MTAITRAGFLVHAETAGFRNRMSVSRRIIENWLSYCQNPYVAFSGGKDSTVLLDLVWEQKSDVVAMFSDDQFILPETESLLGKTANLRRIASCVMHCDWFWSWDDGKQISSGTEWVKPGALDASSQWAHDNGFDGVAVGIRAQENSYRKIAIRRHGVLFYAAGKQLWQCWPLAEWTTVDIWAYILSRGLNYNHAYDRMSELGIPIDRQRIGPYANRRAITQGQLVILKKGWPAEYSRFVADHAQAGRYT